MKFSLSWLREHLETAEPLERIIGRLSSIGLEVEGVEDPAAALAPFVTARVIEAVQHPNADRLRMCRVDVGDGRSFGGVRCAECTDRAACGVRAAWRGDPGQRR